MSGAAYKGNDISDATPSVPWDVFFTRLPLWAGPEGRERDGAAGSEQVDFSGYVTESGTCDKKYVVCVCLKLF